MAKPTLYRDAFGHPVQALSPVTTAQLAIGASSVRVALPAGAEIVRLAANQSCYIEFGNSAVDASAASSALFPPGSELFEVPSGATHIAVIQDGAVTGKLTITSME